MSREASFHVLCGTTSPIPLLTKHRNSFLWLNVSAPKIEFGTPVTPVPKPVLPLKQEFITPRVPTRTGGRKRDASTPAASPSDTFKKPKLVQPQKPVKSEAADKEVVIESGPVEYEKTDESNPMGEEDEFDELEEEDEEPVSAVHLMGHLYEANLDEEYGDFEDYE